MIKPQIDIEAIYRRNQARIEVARQFVLNGMSIGKAAALIGYPKIKTVRIDLEYSENIEPYVFLQQGSGANGNGGRTTLLLELDKNRNLASYEFNGFQFGDPRARLIIAWKRIGAGPYYASSPIFQLTESTIFSFKMLIANDISGSGTSHPRTLTINFPPSPKWGYLKLN